jgi:hypothetical protein
VEAADAAEDKAFGTDKRGDEIADKEIVGSPAQTKAGMEAICLSQPAGQAWLTARQNDHEGQARRLSQQLSAA